MSLACVVGCKADSEDDTGGPLDLDHLESMDTPTKRSEILAAVHEATNQIMIFGGNDGPVVNQIPTARFNDETWVFEPGTGWSEAAIDAGPRARGRYAIEVDEANNRALLFGGRFRREGESGDYRIFNDLWEFDYITREWRELHDGSGTAPPRRYYPMTGYDADTDTFYVYGGNLNANPLNFIEGTDLWAYSNGEWTELPAPTGEQPSRRLFFGNIWDPVRKRMVMFGGQPGDFSSQAFKETYALSVETGVWERLQGPVGAPSTRMHAHLLYDESRDRYVLFGGHTDIGDLNDLWTFDPNGSARWEELHIADVLTNAGLGCMGNPSEVPVDFVVEDLSAPERRHRGMFGLMHDNFWIFGGIHAECSDQVDDTWRYDLETGTWIELIEATAGVSCARRGDDCQCLCI